MNIPALLEAYKVDLAHARQVADLSLALFDAVQGRYELPKDTRRLVEIGGLLHNVGLTTDPPAHHLVGRDIVLRHALEDLPAREQAIVACMVAFHRKKVRPELEPAFLSLGKKGRRLALQLSAILRVGDGLDYSQTQTTAVATVEPGDPGMLLRLTGPHAESDGARAIAKADLWRKVFDEGLELAGPTTDAGPSLAADHTQGDAPPLPVATPTGAGGDPTADPLASPPATGAGGAGEGQGAGTPGVQPVSSSPALSGAEGSVVADETPANDIEEAAGPLLAPWYADGETTLAELGRVLLRRHFRRMLVAEREVRADREIEAVHTLRVTTRRLRASLRLLAPVLTSGQARPIGKAIGRLARTAGAVRDRDVLLADLSRCAAALPEDQRPGLEQICAALRVERAEAHARLLAHFDSREHTEFVAAFATLMNDNSAWDNAPRVRDLAGSTLWRHYEALRAYDHGGLPAAIADLHAMRIEGKRLRYVLELFADTFGPRADPVVAPLIDFQDHLGSLNDTDVARGLVTACAADEAARQAAAAYLTLREAEGERLIAELPARWARVSGGTYRRKLMELIVKL